MSNSFFIGALLSKQPRLNIDWDQQRRRIRKKLWNQGAVVGMLNDVAQILNCVTNIDQLVSRLSWSVLRPCEVVLHVLSTESKPVRDLSCDKLT